MIYNKRKFTSTVIGPVAVIAAALSLGVTSNTTVHADKITLPKGTLLQKCTKLAMVR